MKKKKKLKKKNDDSKDMFELMKKSLSDDVVEVRYTNILKNHPGLFNNKRKCFY